MKYIYIIFLVLIPNLVLSQIIPYDKLTTEVFLDTVSSENGIINMTGQQKDVSNSYYDGFGRPLQTIVQQATATDAISEDIVNFFTYSQLVNGSKSFLPYSKKETNGSYQYSTLNDQGLFYFKISPDGVANDTKPFSQNVTEKSPLAWVNEQGGVGYGWQPGEHSTKYAQRTNNTQEVMYWNADGTRNGYYVQDELWVTEVTDENGNQSLVYKDKDGNTIMMGRQLDETVQNEATVTTFEFTYYIYDKYGRIYIIITPQAIAEMKKTNVWDLNVASVSSLIFKYTYDNLNRPIE